MINTRFGLIARVAFLVICIEIAAFSVLGWFYTNQFGSEMVKRTYASMRRVGEMIASDELPISVIARKTLLTDLIGAPYLNGFAVGGSGHVIVATQPDYLGREAETIKGFNPDWLAPDYPRVTYITGSDTLTAVLHVQEARANSALYHVVITISTAELNAKKHTIAVWGVGASLLFMLFTTFAIVYVAHRLFTGRVNKSLEVLEAIENGALNKRIPITYDDELGRLQGGINSMTEKLFYLLAESREAAGEIQKQKELLQSVIQHAPVGVFWKDRESRIVGCNARYAQDAGLGSPEEAIGKTDDDMIWHEQADLYRMEDQSVMESGKPKLDFEILRNSVAGEQVWLSVSKAPLCDKDDNIIGILGIYTDITARKKAEDEIRNLAYFDPLTGLPNRRLLMDRMEQVLAVSARHDRYGGMLMMDLDNFKDLNDSRGHDVGDLLLREVGKRISHCVRDVDTVARFGGDEFVVILESLGEDESSSANQAMAVAEKIRAAIDRKFEFESVGLSHYITPSIGVTLFNGETETVDALLKQADVALYQAKSAGRNDIRFFNPAMQTQIDKRAQMASGLRRGLEQGELYLYYQPQVDWKGHVIGAEALLRWLPQEGDAISPGQFIPLAEETGLILPIGTWVIEQACEQLKAWGKNPKSSRLTLAVNVSSYQFRQSDFVEQVRETIERYGIDATRLKIELTESVVLTDVNEAAERMQQLKELGVTLSLDDFGTGFSSLSYLKRLPLDQLKIDQAFVHDIMADQSDAAIVRAILAMSESLGIDVIAEGVETEEQYTYLLRHGCEYYQGFFFGRPGPIEEWNDAVAGIESRS